MTLDHLGSTRLLTGSAGSSNVVRYDYLPFGGELLASVDGRTTAMGDLANADSSNLKFTGKNRDGETFLDWFEVRYMSGAQGRFQSVDPGNAGADPSNPQTLNMYSYVGNNPLSYKDPSGMFLEATTIGASSGGPVGAVIGGLVDLGLALFGIFGGGGGHSAPLPEVAWPTQSPIFSDQPCRYPDDCGPSDTPGTETVEIHDATLLHAERQDRDR